MFANTPSKAEVKLFLIEVLGDEERSSSDVTFPAAHPRKYRMEIKE